jgi:hypothetical protein
MDSRLLTIKGAPDVLIDRCGYTTSSDGSTRPLLPADVERIGRIKDTWSLQGKRVILLARKILPGSMLRSTTAPSGFEREVTEFAKSGLTLVGLVGIADPLVSPRSIQRRTDKVVDLCSQFCGLIPSIERRNSRSDQNTASCFHTDLHGMNP